MALNSLQQHTLYVVPIVTGSLSLIASSTIIYSILRSQKKLTVPYRRIVLGLSVLDVFQSMSLTASIFPSPKDTPNTTWALGNALSCDIQGYVTTIGAIGVPLYLCSLSVYYLCIVKFNVKKTTFRKIEPCLHFVPIVYPLFCAIYALAHKYYNNAGAICYVAPKPLICEIFPHVDCVRGEGASRARWILLSCPAMILFVVIFLAMLTLVATATSQVRRNRRYRFSRSFPSGETAGGSSSSSVGNSLRSMGRLLSLRGVLSTAGSNSTPPRVRAALLTQQREVKLQAFFYIGCYILTYGFVWSQSVFILAAKKPPPFFLRCLSGLFFPLQGAFNILIYCRPHVNSLRRLYPDLFPTWFSAFVKVIRAGGDDPFTPEERQRILLRRASTDVIRDTSTSKQSTMDVLSNGNGVSGGNADKNGGVADKTVNSESKQENTDEGTQSCWGREDRVSSMPF